MLKRNGRMIFFTKIRYERIVIPMFAASFIFILLSLKYSDAGRREIIYAGIIGNSPSDVLITNLSAICEMKRGSATWRPIGKSLEVRHIAFLKVHKCASSTVLNIIYRFGMKRNLNYVLPISGNYIKFAQNKGSITEIPPPFYADYDMLCNHVERFQESKFKHYLPHDTIYIAIVRDPFQRMQSAFHYYRDVFNAQDLMQVRGDNPFKTYITNPEHYESQWGDQSKTNNKMARDFGFPFEHFRDENRFRRYIETLDKTFHLVMVQEMFDESLVLMRRLLNWSMKEIIGLAKNRHASIQLSSKDASSKLNPYLALDRILYDHFSSKLKNLIINEGEGFQEEVNYFKILNNKTAAFCRSDYAHKVMSVKESCWHEQFEVTKYDCDLMIMTEISLLDVVRDRQIKKILKFGANMEKLLNR